MAFGFQQPRVTYLPLCITHGALDIFHFVHAGWKWDFWILVGVTWTWVHRDGSHLWDLDWKGHWFVGARLNKPLIAHRLSNDRSHLGTTIRAATPSQFALKGCPISTVNCKVFSYYSSAVDRIHCFNIFFYSSLTCKLFITAIVILSAYLGLIAKTPLDLIGFSRHFARSKT